MTLFVVLLTALTWTQLFSLTAPTSPQLVPGWIAVPLVSQSFRFFWIANGLLLRTGANCQQAGSPPAPKGTLAFEVTASGVQLFHPLPASLHLYNSYSSRHGIPPRRRGTRKSV